MPYCSSCGVQLENNPTFCPSCGVKVSQPVTSTPSPPPPPPPAPVSSPSSSPPLDIAPAAFWGGLLVVVGFFCTWIHSRPFSDEQMNGFQITVNSVKSIKEAGDIKYFFIILAIAFAVLAIFGTLCLVSGISKCRLSQQK